MRGEEEGHEGGFACAGGSFQEDVGSDLERAFYAVENGADGQRSDCFVGVDFIQ